MTCRRRELSTRPPSPALDDDVTFAIVRACDDDLRVARQALKKVQWHADALEIRESNRFNHGSHSFPTEPSGNFPHQSPRAWFARSRQAEMSHENRLGCLPTCSRQGWLCKHRKRTLSRVTSFRLRRSRTAQRQPHLVPLLLQAGDHLRRRLDTGQASSLAVTRTRSRE